MNLNEIKNSGEYIQIFINTIYMIMLFLSIITTRFFQRYNSLMPILYKVRNKSLDIIPLSIILSSLLSSLSLVYITPSTLSFIMLFTSLILITFSFFSVFYFLIYFLYYSKKSLDMTYINTKSKWYYDEMGLKLGFVVILLFFFIPMNFSKLILNGASENELKNYSFYFISGLNMLIFCYIFCLYKIRKYFDKMMLAYIEDPKVSEEIYKSQNKKYMSFKYNKEFKD